MNVSRRIAFVVAIVAGVLPGCRGCSSDGSKDGGNSHTGANPQITPPDYVIEKGPVRTVAGKVGQTRDGLMVEVPAAVVTNGEIQIYVRVSIVEPGKQVHFRSWPEGGWMRLSDDRGTVYKPHALVADLEEKFGAMTRSRLGATIGLRSGTVKPGEPRGEVLIYDGPSATAAYLDLDLDGRNLDFEQPFLFRVPRRMWDSASTAPKPPTRSTSRK